MANLLYDMTLPGTYTIALEVPYFDGPPMFAPRTSDRRPPTRSVARSNVVEVVVEKGDIFTPR